MIALSSTSASTSVSPDGRRGRAADRQPRRAQTAVVADVRDTRDPGDEVTAVCELQLLVCEAVAWPGCRHGDLGDQLCSLERSGGVNAQKLLDRDGPVGAAACDVRGGVERNQAGQVVVHGVRRRNGTADRAAVANLWATAYLLGGGREQAAMRANLVGAGDLSMCRAGAERHQPLERSQPDELVDLADVDDRRRRGPELSESRGTRSWPPAMTSASALCSASNASASSSDSGRS